MQGHAAVDPGADGADRNAGRFRMVAQVTHIPAVLGMLALLAKHRLQPLAARYERMVLIDS